MLLDTSQDLTDRPLLIPTPEDISNSRNLSPLNSPSGLPSITFSPDQSQRTSRLPTSTSHRTTLPQQSYPQPTSQVNTPSLVPHSNLVITMSSRVPMPARGEHAAPAFDKAKPRELSCFFAELEYLFKCADLESDSNKKSTSFTMLTLKQSRFERHSQSTPTPPRPTNSSRMRFSFITPTLLATTSTLCARWIYS